MRRTLLGLAAVLIHPYATMSGQPDQLAKAGNLTIQGTVVDAASTTPLAGAVLVLAARDAAMAIPSRNGTPQLASSRTATSKADGAYAFNDVTVGRYRLRVTRIGYEPETLDIDLTDGAAVSKVSIGLVVMPVQLRTLHVKADASDQFGHMSDPSAADSGRRAAVAAARRRDFLSSDVRELTNADANEAGSMGEADILRAFRHVPGVTGPDDSNVELWIRGARWDQVRVYFDGLPVLDPRHGGGTMSAVGADAIGAAFLHPGVRSVSGAAQGASLVDLRSRAARADSALSGAIGVSTDGSSASFDKRTADGRLGFTMSGRRSFQDIVYLHPILQEFAPSHYAEVASRTDLSIGNDAALELSGLWTQDFQKGIPNATTEHSKSGTTLGRGTLNLRRDDWRLSQSLGASRYAANSIAPYWVSSDSVFPTYDLAAKVRQSSAVTSWIASGKAVRHAPTTDSWLSAGYDVLFERASYIVPSYALSSADSSSTPASRSTSLPSLSGWAERRWQPWKSLQVEAGLRVNMALTSDVERMRLSPSLLASYQLGASTRLTGGVARSFQDVQRLIESSATDVWVLAGHNVPFLAANQASLGIERWQGDSFLFTLNGYARRLTGVLDVRAPADSLEAGMLVTDRLTWSTVHAYGAEASVRKLAGRFTGSVSYSLGRATERSGALTIRAPGERQGTLDATVMIHSGRKRLGTSFITMSGAPYSRTRLVPGKGNRRFAVADTASYTPLYAPQFSSVGLFVDWTGHIRHVAITPYLSAQNVSGRENPTVYFGSCSNVSTTSGCFNNDVFGSYGSYSAANLGLRIVF